MDSAAERFKKYLAERPNADAATALSTHYTMLWRLANGHRKPGLALAFAIQHLTRGWHGGQIRAEEWIETAPKLAAKPRSRAARVARTARAAR